MLFLVSGFRSSRSLAVHVTMQVGLPYLRAKAQDYFEALGGGVDHEVLDEDAHDRQTRSLSEEVRAYLRTSHAIHVFNRTIDCCREAEPSLQTDISLAKHRVRSLATHV